MRSLNVVLSCVIKWSIMALQLKNYNKYKQKNYWSGLLRFRTPSTACTTPPPLQNWHSHQWSFLSYSLADAGGLHLEEGVVHEEVKGLLFPGTAGVLVPAEAAQQLDASSVTWSVVCTVRRSREKDIYDFSACRPSFHLTFHLLLTIIYRLKLF